MSDADAVPRKRVQPHACGTAAVIACLDGVDLEEIRSGAYLQQERGYEGNTVKYSELDDPLKAIQALNDLARRAVNQEQTIRRAGEMIRQGRVTLDGLKGLRGLTEYWNDYSRFWD